VEREDVKDRSSKKDGMHLNDLFVTQDLPLLHHFHVVFLYITVLYCGLLAWQRKDCIFFIHHKLYSSSTACLSRKNYSLARLTFSGWSFGLWYMKRCSLCFVRDGIPFAADYIILWIVRQGELTPRPSCTTTSYNLLLQDLLHPDSFWNVFLASGNECPIFALTGRGSLLRWKHFAA